MCPENVKLLLLTIILFALLLSSCRSEPQLPPTEPPPTVEIPRAAKGYELYSRQVGREWYFYLTEGTDRVKTYDEITAAENLIPEARVRYVVRGVHDIEATLEQIPTETCVLWMGPRTLKQIGVRPGDLALPPHKVVREVQTYCQEVGVHLEVAR